jgi:formylglycine-generating enzyme required for sulfatase activity
MEYVARGPTSREFPWGAFYNSHLANHGAFSTDDTDATDGFAGLAPVGSFPDGVTALGVFDMAGNAAEWVADVWATDEEGFGYPAASQVNPRGPTTGGFHVVRGGSYEEGAAWMRGASRTTTALVRSAAIGFRCAADVGS